MVSALALKPQVRVRVTCTFDVDKRASKSYRNAYSISNRYSTLSQKGYHYQAEADLGLRDGDLAVVVTPTHGYTVVQVVGDPVLLTNGESTQLKWIVDKVDTQRQVDREARLAELKVISDRLNEIRAEETRRLLEERLDNNFEVTQLRGRAKELGAVFNS